MLKSFKHKKNDVRWKWEFTKRREEQWKWIYTHIHTSKGTISRENTLILTESRKHPSSCRRAFWDPLKGMQFSPDTRWQVYNVLKNFSPNFHRCISPSDFTSIPPQQEKWQAFPRSHPGWISKSIGNSPRSCSRLQIHSPRHLNAPSAVLAARDKNNSSFFSTKDKCHLMPGKARVSWTPRQRRRAPMSTEGNGFWEGYTALTNWRPFEGKTTWFCYILERKVLLSTSF